MRPVSALGFGVLLGLVGLRIAAIFVDSSPQLGDQSRTLLPPMAGPSWDHLLGTDQLGRDLLLRMVDSVEAFFLPGLFACLVAAVLAVPAGAVAGYWDGSRGASMLRGLLTMVSAWPRLVLVVLVVAIFTGSVRDPAAWAEVRLYLLGALVGLSYVPQLGGAVSERVQHFRREQFVEAARAHGLSDSRILLWHILWANCRHLVLRHTCTLFGAFILVETSLSYLGDYGVPPPRPSWGNILAGLRHSVVHSRTLIATPEAWTPAGLWAGLGQAIHQGGLLGVVAPTVAIAVSIAGVLALAEHYARRERP